MSLQIATHGQSNPLFGIPADAADPHPRLRASDRGTETILLVDDEPMIRDFLTIALERYGYKVLVASSAPEAIDVASRFQAPIHLVVSDVVMPGGDGCNLCAELRRWYPTIGILLMSGYPDGERAAGESSDDLAFFIRKPFGVAEMASAVRASLDWRPRSGQA